MRVAALAVVLLVGAATRAGGAAPTLVFTPFANVGSHLNGIAWTGTRFVYAENTANTIWTAPPAGAPLARLAQLPRRSEETRCVLSPGTHGFARGAVFCHAPDHRIYEIGRTGRVRLFATLPGSSTSSDGALAVDTVGRFGNGLVAATGRSGAGQPPGGTVFTVDARGRVRTVGSYPGPGGADNIAVAPASFGTAAGDALLTVDAGSRGAVVAVSPRGRARVLVRLGTGPSAILVIGRGPSSAGRVKPGVYLTDDSVGEVYYASGAPLAACRGDVLVGAETTGAFWVVRPHGSRFAATPIGSSLTGATRSLEAMIEIR